MRRETRSLRPPIFQDHPLSGPDNGRDRLFKAQSGLGWLGEKRDQPNESSGDLAATSQIQDQGAKWANLSVEELVFHVSIGYSVLRPYAERSSFPGQRRTASADLESDREIFSSRPEREITI